MTNETQDRFIRIRTVLAQTGLSRATLYRKIDEGKFPKQFKISERCVAWRESDIQQWQRGQAALARSIDDDPSRTL